MLKAKDEAKRFIAAVEAMENRLANDSYARSFAYITGCRESAQVRRSSMDLTRALADMRAVR